MRPAEASALVNASRELLSQSDAVGADRVLSPIMPKLKSDAEALHLMGLIKRTLGHLEEAERYLRSAVAYSLNEGGYYNDLAVVLQALGRRDEAMRLYRAALALTPEAVAVRVNMVRCLMEDDDLVGAEREARAYVAVQPSPDSWMLLCQVQRAAERHEEALAAAASALKLAPKQRSVQHSYAIALEKAGRRREALDAYKKLAAQDLDSQDLALNLGRALYAEGLKNDAETVVEQGLAKWPASVALHTTLARMRALRGESERATAAMEAEIARRPADLALRLACADALHRNKNLPKALQILDDALRLAPDHQTLLTAYGIILDELDRPVDGLAVLRRVAALSGQSHATQRNLLSTLIRAGQPSEALEIARLLRNTDTDDQYLIACEALSQRALGDVRYRALNDYDRYVHTYDIPAPRNFFTVENFNTSFAELLRRQHRIAAHPLDQTLHNGSQTSRTLLALEDPVLAAFKGSMDVAVRDYIGRLRTEEGDPVGRRKRDRYRFSGLWSTRLLNEGFQPNHVHDRGWISAVYFVANVAAERTRNPCAGWLKFGEPNRPVAGCPAERLIEPKIGSLVLFPSYLWHGVAPFEGEERITASFDVVPA